jgi:hypothetical protein
VIWKIVGPNPISNSNPQVRAISGMVGCEIGDYVVWWCAGRPLQGGWCASVPAQVLAQLTDLIEDRASSIPPELHGP